MKRAALVLALLAAYALGTLQPHASASSDNAIVGVIEQLKGIRQELQAIRRRFDGDR